MPDCLGLRTRKFLLKRAQPGKYLVHVNYYGNRQQIISGATTVQLEMTTDFGKPNAKTKDALRLQGSKEVIKVGELSLGKRTNNKPSARMRSNMNLLKLIVPASGSCVRAVILLPKVGVFRQRFL